jgi:hypothetical protein
MPKHSSHILQLARRGAEARYRELIDELKMLTATFPHLRDAVDRDELPIKFLLRQGRDKAEVPLAPSNRRRRMSPAQRKAVSQRMRKYWAARRKAETRK